MRTRLLLPLALVALASAFAVAALAGRSVDARFEYGGATYFGPSEPLTRQEATRRFGALTATRTRIEGRRVWRMRASQGNPQPTIVLLERDDRRLESFSIMPED